MSALILHRTPWARSSDGSVTIPAATVGSRLVVTSAGGAIVVATGFTLRTTYPAGNTVDLSVQDRVATGGETTVALTGVGDNCAGEIIEFAAGTTFVSAGNPPGSNSNGTDDATNNHIVNQTAVTATAQSVLVSLFLAITGSTYAEHGAGTVKWYGHGPYGVGHNAAATGGGGTQSVIRSVVSDVDATHAWPATNAAGHYQATSVWFQGGDKVYAAQVLYANTSGLKANPPVSPIVAENSLPGTLNTHWYLGGASTNATIAAYTGSPFYSPGDTVDFKIDSTGHTAQVEVYRTGAYGYDLCGARHVLGNEAGYLPVTVTTQPATTVDPVHGCSVCDWTTNATWTIPADACPGVYVYNARRTDAGNTANVCQGMFVVQGNITGGHVIVRPTPTDRAYNPWGATTDHGTDLAGTWTGADLYQDGASGASSDFSKRATAVSTQCPNAVASARDMTSYWDAEHGSVIFLEQQGINLGYVDEYWLDANPHGLDSAASVLPIGHHEYISTGMYDAYQNALAAGVSTFWQSANTGGWRTRIVDNLEVCFKDTGTREVSPPAIGSGYDPDGPTGTWRDGHPTGTDGDIPNPDQRFESALTGQRFVWSGPINETLAIDAAHKAVPVWRNSASVQALTGSSTYATGVNDLGYEVDAADNGFGQPSNLIRLFVQSLTDAHGADLDGATYDTTVTADSGWTVWRHTSGALVVNTGWRGMLSVTRRHGASTYNQEPVSLDVQNAYLCLMVDLLRAVPATLSGMEADTDTVPTDPALSGFASRDAAALAYGLTVPKSNFGAFFAV